MTKEILIFLLLPLIGTLAYGAIKFAPWVPCFNKDLPRIFKHAKLNSKKVFYDLGSGTGKTVFYANKKFNSYAKGIEVGLPLYIYSKFKQILLGNKKVQIKFGDFYKHDISDADVVYLYGMNNTLHEKLKHKLNKELKKGTRIISYAFPFPNWEPEYIDKPKKTDTSIYVYKR